MIRKINLQMMSGLRVPYQKVLRKYGRGYKNLWIEKRRASHFLKKPKMKLVSPVGPWVRFLKSSQGPLNTCNNILKYFKIRKEVQICLTSKIVTRCVIGKSLILFFLVMELSSKEVKVDMTLYFDNSLVLHVQRKKMFLSKESEASDIF